jgi:hypothetical protein
MRSLNSHSLSRTKRNRFSQRRMRMKMMRIRHLNRTASFYVATTEWKKLATYLFRD